MGLAATTWVPMGAQVLVLTPNDHPNPSQGRQKGFRSSGFWKKFSGATEQPTSVKNGASPHWQGPIGGGGYPEFGPRTPPWVRGSIYEKKVVRTQVQIDTQQPQYAKNF